jgi:hypothetical protein
MTALSKIQTAGFMLALVNGKLNVTPTKTALTDTQRIFIKSHKDEIVKQLLSSSQLQQNIREAIEERAAIMEFDGGLSRANADIAAAKSMRVYCYRVTDKPNSELTVIMPSTELDEAEVKLREKYGDRLLSVMPMAAMAESPTKH